MTVTTTETDEVAERWHTEDFRFDLDEAPTGGPEDCTGGEGDDTDG